MDKKSENPGVYPDHVVLSKIYVIRNQKVMIDKDLADLYGVGTRTLNQAVKRNLQRFPMDFMFQMTSEELENWKSQIVISNREKMGIRKTPLVFSEQGVAMLSSVLNSERAILVNIQIIKNIY
ncbi:MAG: ORF6N domain-containing protein [Bacteroidales bacterium]